MLEALNVSLEIDGPGDSEENSTLRLLDAVNFNVPPGHLLAIVEGYRESNRAGSIC